MPYSVFWESILVFRAEEMKKKKSLPFFCLPTYNYCLGQVNGAGAVRNNNTVCREMKKKGFTIFLFAHFYNCLGQVNGACVASMQFGTTTPSVCS
jgi:hypothetical protein